MMAKKLRESPLCLCGHTQFAHIREEGACRPGFTCAVRCEKFVQSAPVTSSHASKPNRLNLKPELQKAIDAIERGAGGDPLPQVPERDWRLIAFKQLEQLHLSHLKEIEHLADIVQRVKLSAKAAHAELMVRREILEERLGVQKHRCLSCREMTTVTAEGLSECCGTEAEAL